MDIGNKKVSTRENSLKQIIIKLKQIISKINIRAYTMIAILVLIWGIMSFATKGNFLSPRNLALLARQATVTSIIALGMVFVIVSRNIDLSVGSLLGLCGAIVAILQVNYNLNIWLAMLITILIGIIIGVWQGFWIAYKKVPAFIVTLGGLLIFRGILLGITKSVSISVSSSEFKNIAQGYVAKDIGWILGSLFLIIAVVMIYRGNLTRKKYGFKTKSGVVLILQIGLFSGLILVFTYIMNDYQGVPIPVLILLGLACIMTIIAKKTKFGRSVYAIGGNPEAAKYSGINTKRATLILFILNGLLCAIAGIILTARLGAATSNAGDMVELDVIAACVIGGTSLLGGIGSVPFAIIGALVMASLDNGMSLLNTESFWQPIIKGLILIIAVWFDITTKKK